MAMRPAYCEVGPDSLSLSVPGNALRVLLKPRSAAVAASNRDLHTKYESPTFKFPQQIAHFAQRIRTGPILLQLEAQISSASLSSPGTLLEKLVATQNHSFLFHDKRPTLTVYLAVIVRSPRALDPLPFTLVAAGIPGQSPLTSPQRQGLDAFLSNAFNAPPVDLTDFLNVTARFITALNLIESVAEQSTSMLTGVLSVAQSRDPVECLRVASAALHVTLACSPASFRHSDRAVMALAAMERRITALPYADR